MTLSTTLMDGEGRLNIDAENNTFEALLQNIAENTHITREQVQARVAEILDNAENGLTFLRNLNEWVETTLPTALQAGQREVAITLQRIGQELKKLVDKYGKSPQELFKALKTKNGLIFTGVVTLVLIACLAPGLVTITPRPPTNVPAFYTETPAPTSTPAATSNVEGSETPDATVTPENTPTPLSTDTAEPTETPERTTGVVLQVERVESAANGLIPLDETFALTLDCNFDEMTKTDVNYDGGTRVFRTVPCDYIWSEDNQQYSLDWGFFSANMAEGKAHVGTAPNGSSVLPGQAVNEDFQNFIDQLIKGDLAAREISGRRVVKLWIGRDAAKILRTRNPFNQTLAPDSPLVEDYLAFARSKGDLSKLKGQFLISYQSEIVDTPGVKGSVLSDPSQSSQP